MLSMTLQGGGAHPASGGEIAVRYHVRWLHEPAASTTEPLGPNLPTDGLEKWSG